MHVSTIDSYLTYIFEAVNFCLKESLRCVVRRRRMKIARMVMSAMSSTPPAVPAAMPMIFVRCAVAAALDALISAAVALYDAVT